MLKTPNASAASTKSRIPRPTTSKAPADTEVVTERSVTSPQKYPQICSVEHKVLPPVKPAKKKKDAKKKSKVEEKSVSKKITAVVHQALAVNQALAARKTPTKPKLLSYKVENDELPDIQAKQGQDEYHSNDVKVQENLTKEQKPCKDGENSKTTKLQEQGENVRTEIRKLSASPTRLQTKHNEIDKDMIPKKKKSKKVKEIIEIIENEQEEFKPSKKVKKIETHTNEKDETQNETTIKLTKKELPKHENEPNPEAKPLILKIEEKRKPDQLYMSKIQKVSTMVDLPTQSNFQTPCEIFSEDKKETKEPQNLTKKNDLESQIPNDFETKEITPVAELEAVSEVSHKPNIELPSELTAPVISVSEAKPMKKKVKKLTKKVKKMKPTEHDELLETEFPVVKSSKQTSRSPSPTAPPPKPPRSPTPHLLTPQPWIDKRSRSPSPFLQQRPASRLGEPANLSGNEMKQSPCPKRSRSSSPAPNQLEIPVHESRKLTPLPKKGGSLSLSPQESTTPIQEPPNARSIVDLEQVIKLFAEKKVPLQVSDLMQLLGTKQFEDDASTKSSVTNIETSASLQNLAEFEEIEQDITSNGIKNCDPLAGASIPEVSNITIQINGEDSKVSETDSNAGASEEGMEVEIKKVVNHFEEENDETTESDYENHDNSFEEEEEEDEEVSNDEGSNYPEEEMIDDNVTAIEADVGIEEVTNDEDSETEEEEEDEDEENEEVSNDEDSNYPEDEMTDDNVATIEKVTNLNGEVNETEEQDETEGSDGDVICDEDERVLCNAMENGINLKSKLIETNESEESEDELFEESPVGDVQEIYSSVEDDNYENEKDTESTEDTHSDDDCKPYNAGDVTNAADCVAIEDGIDFGKENEINIESNNEQKPTSRPSSKIGQIISNIVRSITPSRPSSKSEECTTKIFEDEIIENDPIMVDINPTLIEDTSNHEKQSRPSSRIEDIVNNIVRTLTSPLPCGAKVDKEEAQNPIPEAKEEVVNDLVVVENLDSNKATNQALQENLLVETKETTITDPQEGEQHEENVQSEEETCQNTKEESSVASIETKEGAGLKEVSKSIFEKDETKAELKEALESIQEMKKEMAQLMALISSSKSPLLPNQEVIESINSTELHEMTKQADLPREMKTSIDFAKSEEPCISIHHVDDVTLEFSKDTFMNESALKQNEEVEAGVSEDPLLPVFEQRRVFELETMKALMNEAEKNRTDLKVSPTNVPLKSPIPAEDDASEVIESSKNGKVEDKEDSFDSNDREVEEIFIEHSIIIENSSLSKQHGFTTIEDQTDEQSLCNCQMKSKFDSIFLKNSGEEAMSEQKLLTRDNLSEDGSKMDVIPRITTISGNNSSKQLFEPVGTMQEPEEKTLEKNDENPSQVVHGEDVLVEYEVKERKDDYELSSDNLPSLDPSNETGNSLHDSGIQVSYSTDESKSQSTEDFEIVDKSEIEHSMHKEGKEMQETKECLNSALDDEIPNITCRLCKERGSKEDSHTHKKSIEDLITFFNVMTHYRNEHHCEARSRNGSAERKSRRQSSLKLSSFELDLDDKNDQLNHPEKDNEIEPRRSFLPPPPRDYLKPVYMHPRPWYPTYSRLNQSQQELASNNWLKEESRNENCKQSYESLVYPESLMRCKSESNLKKTLKFSVSMKELDTDMLTISFDGDNVNISSSSKVLTQSSIDVQQQGGETIFNVRANPTSQINDEKKEEEVDDDKKLMEAEDDDTKLVVENEKNVSEIETAATDTEPGTMENDKHVEHVDTVEAENDPESSSVETVIDTRRKSLTERYDVDIPPAKLFYFDELDNSQEDKEENVKEEHNADGNEHENDEVFEEAPEVISGSGSFENIVDLDDSPKKSPDTFEGNKDIVNEELEKELDLIATAKIYQYGHYPSQKEVVSTQYHIQDRKLNQDIFEDTEEEEGLERYYHRGSLHSRFKRVPIRPGGRHRRYEPILSSPQVWSDFLVEHSDFAAFFELVKVEIITSFFIDSILAHQDQGLQNPFHWQFVNW